MTTRSYTAFGLEIESELTLPQLTPSSSNDGGAPDVTVTRGPVVMPEVDTGDEDHHFVDPMSYYVSYGVGDTAVENGTEIRVDAPPDAPITIVRRLVVGPLLNFLLHQRGYLVLHASTVQVGDEAVAFIGESGDGKSTTATAFLAAGHRILSDDVAAIRVGDGVPTVQPGYPAVKLDPDAVEALEFDLDGRPVEMVETARQFYRFDERWTSTAIPLARVYRLEYGPNVEVLSLPSGERCMELVENTYTRGTLEMGDASITNFERCATVANAVPVKRLRRPRRFDALPAVVDVVCDDLESNG